MQVIDQQQAWNSGRPELYHEIRGLDSPENGLFFFAFILIFKKYCITKYYLLSNGLFFGPITFAPKAQPNLSSPDLDFCISFLWLL